MAIIKSIRLTRYPITTNPTVFDLCVESLDLKKGQKYADVPCLLSVTPSKEKAGINVSGSITLNLTKQTAYLISMLSIGAVDTEVNATATAWTANTIHAVGDIVNHSNGKNSLTAIKITGTGKTGAKEPLLSPTTSNNTYTVNDGGVVWAVTPLLKKATSTLKNNTPKFIIEYGIDDETGNPVFYRQFIGCVVNKLPLKAEVDDKVPQVQLDILADTVVDSIESGFTSISTGANIVTLGKDYYGAGIDSKKVLFNGNPDYVDLVDVNIDRGLTVKHGLNGFTTQKGVLKIDGKISLQFNATQYENYKTGLPFSMDMIFDGYGPYTKYIFERVFTEDTDPIISNKEDIKLEPPIWCEGNTVVTSEVVYPSFVDSVGNVVQF